MAERKAKYNPDANRRWSEKNPERRKYLSHRSRARSFVRDVATLDDLNELAAMIDERKAELEKTTTQDCASAKEDDTVD